MRQYWIAIALATSFCSTLAVAQADERIALEISEETTFFTEPVTDEGIIDYVAALNAHYGEGVSNEDNAFVFLLGLFPMEEAVTAYWELLETEMDIQMDPESLRFVTWPDFAEEQGIDQERADEIFYGAARRRPWGAEDFPQLARWLELNEPVFKELLRLTQYDQYYSPLVRSESDDSINEVRLPHLILLREFAHGLVFHAQLALGRDDVETAVNDVVLLHHLGALSSFEMTHLGKLVGISIQALAELVVVSLAERGSLDHALALALLHGRRSAVQGESMDMGIHMGERSLALDMIQRSALGQEPGWEYFWQDKEEGIHGARTLTRLAQSSKFDLDRSLRQINDLFDELYQQREIDSLRERKAAARAFDIDIWESFDGEMYSAVASVSVAGHLYPDWDSQRYTDAVTDFYSQPLLTPAGSSYRTEHRSQTRRLVESIAIAMLGYRDVHGELPESLDALVPVYFEAVPVDPYSEEPMVYRVHDDGSALVYSIGDNFEDDAGVDDYTDGDIAIRIGAPPADSQ